MKYPLRYPLTFFYFLCFFLIGCPSPQQQCPKDLNYVPPLSTGDGGAETPVEAATPCGKACENLRKLGCAEGKATPAGTRCYDVCVQSPEMLSVSCVIAAKATSDLAACHVRCLPK